MMHDGGEAGRSGPAADSGRRLWRVLLLSGVALYVASWFFPAVALQVDAGWPRAPWGYGVEAHRGANDLLTRDLTGNDDAWLIRAAGATCLTNYAMVLAIAAALVRRPWTVFCGTALLACAALDLVWIYMFRGDVDDELRGPMLRAGYYMWVASFAWVGIALILRRPSFR